MYCIFSNLGGIEIFLYPNLLHQKIVLGGGIKIDVTEMIHLLTFQSINNVLYFIFQFWGGIEIFLYPHPVTPKKKIVWGGGYKNDVTEMIHLLTFQSINNVLYFFLIWGGIEIFFLPPLPYKTNLQTKHKKTPLH